MKRPLATLAAVALAGYLGALRHRLRYWGSTEEEAARRLPGDDLIPGARGGATMATTLKAPPEAIWPWLVQLRYAGRARDEIGAEAVAGLRPRFAGRASESIPT